MQTIFNKNFTKSLLSAILLWLAWCPNGYSFLIFLGFVPLLIIEFRYWQNRGRKTNAKFFGFSYLTMLIWNLLTTWWVTYASFEGALLAFIMNSLLMSLVLLLFHHTHKKTNHLIGYSSFICYWLAFEYLHLNWDMSWPWLTLGNAFADSYKYIQWYEFTGTQGGSLWILLLNVLVFYWLFIVENKKKIALNISLLIVLPTIVSVVIYYNYSEKIEPVNIVVSQPNIDPYNEKFSGMMNEEQIIKSLKVSSNLIDKETDYWVAPETTIALDVQENELDTCPEVKILQKIIDNYPNLKMVLGASTYIQYDEPITVTARQNKNNYKFYDSFNSAIQVEKNSKVKVYHKSKLVPGVEIIPFPKEMKYFEKYAINLGGSTGSLGMQNDREVFANATNKGVVAPIICYESVYSEYVRNYVKNGANILFIVTNDGWWDNTPGHIQHLAYARLRAIENRRSIARSANTGISAFYNQRGDIIQQTKWWQATAIKAALNLNNQQTLFVILGDIIYKIAVAFSFCIVVATMFSKQLKIKN